MIHFFPRFSKTAEDTPYGQALRSAGVAHRIFGTSVPQTYRRRSQLLLVGYPKLAWSALRLAARSLLLARPRPDAVVVSSDVETLVFALVRLLPFAARARIVFIPFIFTQRSSAAANWLRMLYYRFVARRVSLAVCHSALEPERYQALFAGCGTRFVFVPWGTHVASTAEVLAGRGTLPPEPLPVVAAAGRSGRDYPTLAAAAAALPCRLVIICNETVALGGVAPSGRVEVLRDTFGLDYLRQLLRASVVVVPLRVEDISAGQMVLIQAMSLARPLIVTRTPTVGDYLEDGVNALLVPRGDVPAMEQAIRRLLDNPADAEALGRRAQQDYAARFSGQAHMNALVRAILDHCAVRKP